MKIVRFLLFGNGRGLKSLVLRVMRYTTERLTLTVVATSDSSEDEDGDSAITHRVLFKCIGCTKELRYQLILAEVARRMRQCEEVPVKVVKEPNNPVDPRAIAFVCKLNQLKNGRELAM